MDSLRVALPWCRAGAVGSGYSAADGARPVVIRGGGRFLFPGGAALWAAQTMEIGSGGGRGGSGRMGGGQRAAFFPCDRGGSRGAIVWSGGGDLLAREQAARNAGGPAARSVLHGLVRVTAGGVLLLAQRPVEVGIDSPISAVPSAFVAMLMVMASYEEEKRRIERNMLALSNLNLATSSFVGGEIQRMLAQALDRVLGVVRLPSGALFLHHGDPQGPTSVVAVGLSDDFCRVAQEEGLDDYLVGLVARLGGLLGFRDLKNAESVAALEREEPIRRFRQLALAQGLRSVVAISLQAKEQAFGVLLLGTPDSRRFTPAEYRLLLALGHQIGMAVENSYLIQQTSRRSEELHVLNEIGRALSSTLNKEDLLSKIWEELRRLFDVENFYIAELDPVRDEMRFHL